LRRRRLTGSAAALAVALPGAPPLHLPGDARVASVRADRSTWIVGARPSAAATRIAVRIHARRLTGGAWLVARPRARPLAVALRRRGLLVFAEPNRLARRLQAPADDPLSPQARWRDAVVPPGLAPPAVTPQSPLLALIDSQLDTSHPEWQGGNVTSLGSGPPGNEHGTATAAVAAAPANGVGILGIWPGMRALNVPLPGEITCADSVNGIATAIRQKARVINMSYGSPSLCFAEYLAIQSAIGSGITVVAAAGNEFASGNPLEFPASLPHVVTVAAVGPDLQPSYFSSSSAAVDLTAPGEGILTAVPASFDDEPPADGYAHLAGTSFAAPMVAAAATWLRAARPSLSRDQVTQVLRASARDLDRKGWDPATGFGLVQMGAALKLAAPVSDPFEPNDDMVWIDGRAFKKPDPAVYRGSGTKSITAEIDRYEDPSDVYRIVVPGHARVHVSVAPRSGDPDLAVYRRGATSIGDASRLLSVSRRGGGHGDGITFTNRERTSRSFYARVYIHPTTSRLDSAYVLRITRVRR